MVGSPGSGRHGGLQLALPFHWSGVVHPHPILCLLLISQWYYSLAHTMGHHDWYICMYRYKCAQYTGAIDQSVRVEPQAENRDTVVDKCVQH